MWLWSDVAAWLETTYELPVGDPDTLDDATIAQIDATLSTTTPGGWHPAGTGDQPRHSTLRPHATVKASVTVVPGQPQAAHEARTTDELVGA